MVPALGPSLASLEPCASSRVQKKSGVVMSTPMILSTDNPNLQALLMSAILDILRCYQVNRIGWVVAQVSIMDPSSDARNNDGKAPLIARKQSEVVEGTHPLSLQGNNGVKRLENVHKDLVQPLANSDTMEPSSPQNWKLHTHQLSHDKHWSRR